jgi:hypothetical protein
MVVRLLGLGVSSGAAAFLANSAEAVNATAAIG